MRFRRAPTRGCSEGADSELGSSTAPRRAGRSRRLSRLGERRAEIAADEDLADPRQSPSLPQSAVVGALAVGAGDSDERDVQRTAGPALLRRSPECPGPPPAEDRGGRAGDPRRDRPPDRSPRPGKASEPKRASARPGVAGSMAIDLAGRRRKRPRPASSSRRIAASPERPRTRHQHTLSSPWGRARSSQLERWPATASARRMETIQKRTMIFGLGPPLELVSGDGWEPCGKTRRPVSLNEATWIITESRSRGGRGR